MGALYHIIAELLGRAAQFLGEALVGEALAHLTEQPRSRAWRALQARISVPLVIAGWLGAGLAMYVGWRLGVRKPGGWARAAATAL